jgi:signal transduction histidine kinase
MSSSPPPADREVPGTRRWVLGCAFAGLVILMLAAGYTALADLNHLHADELLARRQFVQRTQAVSGLCLSIETYNQTAERFLASPEPSGPDRDQMDRLHTEITAVLRDFPAGDADDLAAVRAIESLFANQKTMFEQMFSWSNEQRRLRAVETIHRDIEPIQISILDWSDRLRSANDRELQAADQTLLAQFSSVQSALTRSLVLALGCGLMLVLASMIYILKLERQTQSRYRELQRGRGELERLSASLVDAQESERRTISRELHDEVGQTLGALLVDFGRLSASLASAPPELREQVDRMKSVTERSVRSVRDLALLLRPSMLDDLGLMAALEWQGRETSRTSSTEVDVRAKGVPENLPDEVNVAIYRLVQEALTNAARHSGARNASVVVTGDGPRIVVEVRDDGRGFDPQHTRGLGILGMEERVRRLGGKLTIDSHPGHGACVRAELPLERA